MEDFNEIVVTVKKVRGHCAAEHKVGDKAVFKSKSIEGEICFGALCSMIPKVYGMRYGADLPWLKNKDVATHACPDPENPVTFELRRIKNDAE
jgi:uncharacterized repeat protein (TIGR04076 family)